MAAAKLDITTRYTEIAHTKAEEAAREVLAAIRECHYGYARDLLGKVREYLDALERIGAGQFKDGTDEKEG